MKKQFKGKFVWNILLDSNSILALTPDSWFANLAINMANNLKIRVENFSLFYQVNKNNMTCFQYIFCLELFNS